MPVSRDRNQRTLDEHDTIQPLEINAVPPVELQQTPLGMSVRLAHAPGLKHVVLKEDVPASAADKTSAVLGYDPVAGQFVDTVDSPAFSNQVCAKTADPQDAGLYLKHERHVCYYDPQSDQYLPVAGPAWHLGKTDVAIAAGGAGTVSIWKADLDDEDVDSDTSEAIDSGWDVTATDFFGRGLPGDTLVMVFFHHQSRSWYVLRAASDVIRFKLIGSLQANGTALGQQVTWNGSAYVTVGAEIGLVDPTGLLGPAALGAVGWAVRSPDRGKVTLNLPDPPGDAVEYDCYEMVSLEGQARWIRATLVEDLGQTTVGMAAATVVEHWGHPAMGDAPDMSPGGVTVVDATGLFARALAGADCQAVLYEQDNQYHLVHCEQQTTMYLGQIDQAGGLAHTDLTVPVDGLTAVNGQAQVATTLTASNTFSLAANDNAKCLVIWNDSEQTWELVQVA